MVALAGGEVSRNLFYPKIRKKLRVRHKYAKSIILICNKMVGLKDMLEQATSKRPTVSVTEVFNIFKCEYTCIMPLCCRPEFKRSFVFTETIYRRKVKFPT